MGSVERVLLHLGGVERDEAYPIVKTKMSDN
jgi:hypothetical protein